MTELIDRMKRWPYTRGTPWERFCARVVLPSHWQDEACWEWGGRGNGSGYGQITIAGRTVTAHRFAYERWKGPVPDGMELDHLCRNRNCCNPAHLEAVPRRTNILRGVSPTAQNATKTHCKRGHALAGENVYLMPGHSTTTPRRACKSCQAQRRRDSSARTHRESPR